ncbi:MAG: NADH:ubiquinone reductase (Na(+)-transporting) subunit C [Muribaculaceae bacterium]|nr:NADH:ubiquinone reductase (Na(+)-transporting) subunit C [Muribaculaceae bacterium]
MNKQSNTYTIIYIIVLVVVVGAALALTSMSLKERQTANANADKMRQILASVKITPAEGQVIDDYNKYIVESFLVNADGQRIDGDAFNVNMKEAVKQPADKRQLPVFECKLADGAVKYIIPAYGAGLWGPIWGYLSVDSDGSTVYGAYFSHEGETPGLGANIAEPAFYGQFNSSLHLLKDGRMVPIEVVKKGMKPTNENADYVDGVSGGTITSKGVGAMLDNCLTPYEAFLKNLSNR